MAAGCAADGSIYLLAYCAYCVPRGTVDRVPTVAAPVELRNDHTISTLRSCPCSIAYTQKAIRRHAGNSSWPDRPRRSIMGVRDTVKSTRSAADYQR